MEQRELLCTSRESVNCGTNTSEKPPFHYWVKLTIHIPCSPAFLIISVYPRCIFTGGTACRLWSAWVACMAVLFVTARTWKQPKHLLVGESIKLCYICWTTIQQWKWRHCSYVKQHGWVRHEQFWSKKCKNNRIHTVDSIYISQEEAKLNDVA